MPRRDLWCPLTGLRGRGGATAIVRCAMDAHRQSGRSQGTPRATSGDRPAGDPWHAFGYVASGVGVYGALGWLCDQWLGTTFLVAVGILLGACFGIYLT